MRNSVTSTILILASLTVWAHAQSRSLSNESSVKLVAVVPESVRITVPVEAARFEFYGTRAAAAIPIALSWNLRPNSRQRVELAAYFDNPATALEDAHGNQIPADRLTATVDGASIAGSKSDASGDFLWRSVATDNNFDTQTATVRLGLNLDGLNLPAGTYTGILHLQIRAF